MPEQDLYVQTIRKSSAHLLDLLNDVLYFFLIKWQLVLHSHEFDLYASMTMWWICYRHWRQRRFTARRRSSDDDVPHYLVGMRYVPRRFSHQSR